MRALHARLGRDVVDVGLQHNADRRHGLARDRLVLVEDALHGLQDLRVFVQDVLDHGQHHVGPGALNPQKVAAAAGARRDQQRHRRRAVLGARRRQKVDDLPVKSRRVAAEVPTGRDKIVALALPRVLFEAHDRELVPVALFRTRCAHLLLE